MGGAADTSAMAWLLAGDPSIRWQVMRDLTDAPESAWRVERERVATEGFGAAVLDAQGADGAWDGGAVNPRGFTIDDQWREGQAWTPTIWTLDLLRNLGVDPSAPRVPDAVERVRTGVRLEHNNAPFFDGEEEECMNGRTVSAVAYFGVDVRPVLDRVVGDAQPDGGWNCERVNGSRVSSVFTTIAVLEGLLEAEIAGVASTESGPARKAGEESLLRHGLFRRSADGEPIRADVMLFAFPRGGHYDILWALDYLRTASLVDGTAPDPRLASAIEVVRSRRREDGTWGADHEWRGRTWVNVEDPVEERSRWITLFALRVLRWWEQSS